MAAENWREMLGQGNMDPMKRPSEVKNSYVFGIRRKGKKFLGFVERKPENQTSLPFQNVVSIEEGWVSHNEATTRAEDMLAEFREQKKEAQWVKDKAGAVGQRQAAIAAGLCVSGDPEVIPVGPGSVVTHSDSEGQHYALILSIEGIEATALFVSSSRWGGPTTRPASESECHLLGVMRPKARSYLVKVVRPLRDFCAATAVVDSKVLSGFLEEFA